MSKGSSGREEQGTGVPGQRGVNAKDAKKWLKDVHAFTTQDLDKTLAWYYSLELTELRITSTPDGWRVIVKAKKKSKRLVAFLVFDSFSKALAATSYLAERDSLSFYKDKFPPKM